MSVVCLWYVCVCECMCVCGVCMFLFAFMYVRKSSRINITRFTSDFGEGYSMAGAVLSKVMMVVVVGRGRRTNHIGPISPSSR